MPVKVTGLRETQRALRKIDGQLESKLLKEDLKQAVEPVASTAREKIGHYRGARTGRIRPVVMARGVYVRQSEPKRSGLRGDFGSLQWRKLAASLDEREGEVVDNLAKALNRINARAGL